LKWLKDIFHGKGAEGRTIILGRSDIGVWLEKRSKNSEFEERLQDIYNRLEEMAADFDRDIKNLRSAEPDTSTPPKLLRAGLAARGEVVKQMESLAEKLMPPKGKDIESASEHHWTLVKGLERTVTTFARAKSYAAALFQKNIESINSDLTKISHILVELEEEIGKRRKELEEIWYSRELVAGLDEELSRIDDLRRKVKEEEEKLAELSASFAVMEADQKRLAASEQGQRTEELKMSLDQKRQELSQTEAEVADLIAPLTKALSRIMKQGSSDRLNLQHEAIFEQLRTSPSQVPDSEIAGSLKELKGHLASLGLKDRKKEKTLGHIDLLIKKKSLQNARARHVKLEKEIEELEGLLAESSREALHLKDALTQARKTIRSLETNLDKSRRDLAALDEKANRDESELKERLGKLAERPVEIDLLRGSG
jgi:DNA repair exonuclease SbcCD ATPase subunit